MAVCHFPKLLWSKDCPQPNSISLNRNSASPVTLFQGGFNFKADLDYIEVSFQAEAAWIFLPPLYFTFSRKERRNKTQYQFCWPDTREGDRTVQHSSETKSQCHFFIAYFPSCFTWLRGTLKTGCSSLLFPFQRSHPSSAGAALSILPLGKWQQLDWPWRSSLGLCFLLSQAFTNRHSPARCSWKVRNERQKGRRKEKSGRERNKKGRRGAIAIFHFPCTCHTVWMAGVPWAHSTAHTFITLPLLYFIHHSWVSCPQQVAASVTARHLIPASKASCQALCKGWSWF